MWRHDPRTSTERRGKLTRLLVDLTLAIHSKNNYNEYNRKVYGFNYLFTFLLYVKDVNLNIKEDLL